MLRMCVTGGLLWSCGMACMTLALAADAVPAPRPLLAPGKAPFLEGVDAPQPKPSWSPRSPSAKPRPSGVQTEAVAAKPSSCDLSGVLFTAVPAIHGETSGDLGCGIEQPVAISGVQQGTLTIAFPRKVTVSCKFAKVLTAWLKEEVAPVVRARFQLDLKGIRSGPGYQCRRRNNRPEGKLSEHALGMAVDIGGFELSDGTYISVEKDWGTSSAKGRFLDHIRKSACKRFTTVLSPEGDAFHKSHLHLDIGCHGKTCTYLICQ